jgi:hypothetical protein
MPNQVATVRLRLLVNVRVLLVVILWAALPRSVAAQPTTVGGDSFELVATRVGPQLFLLVSDSGGRIYAGNNSNDVAGIPVQRFDPSAKAFRDFGPPVGDADGMTFGGAAVLVADQDQGIMKVPVANPAGAFLFRAGVAQGPFGSPFAYRPSDGHIFAGEWPDNSIREYDSSGALVATYPVAKGVETMVFDPGSGRIYYADFGSEVRSFDPATGLDSHIGFSSGVIDGGLFYDSLTGLVFVGTANATNPGLVELIDPATHTTTLFATGFSGCTGILRDPVSGDLYFLDGGAHPSTGRSDLYRLKSRFIPPARIRLTPESAINRVNSSHSLQATVEGDHPLENVPVIFDVTTGPNSGRSGTVMTDAAGRAAFSYIGTGGEGLDELVASFVSSDGRTIVSNTVQKRWVIPRVQGLILPSLLTGGCQTGTGTVTLEYPAPAGGVTVLLSTTTAGATIVPSLKFPAGIIKKTFKISTSAVLTMQSGEVQAGIDLQSRTAALAIRPIGIKSLVLSPNPVVGGNPATGTVTLQCAAAPGDVFVALSSTIPSVAQPTVAGITIPQGTRTGIFTVSTNAVAATTTASIKAVTKPGAVSKSAKLKVTR